MIKVYKDMYGNTATIEKVRIMPYKEAQTKCDAYKLTASSDYENGFIYFVSVYESIGDAIKKLNNMSCGTFKEI